MGKIAEEKKGTITEVIFHNSQNGYTVAVFETEDEEFNIVGFMADAVKGYDYILRGEFIVHPSYGEQFSFAEYEQLAPQGAKAVEAFLASGTIKGVGRKTAALIVEAFGEDTFEVFENNPERLMEVSGIGKKKYEMIIESYNLHREFARVSMYLQSYGISPGQIVKIYRQYGTSSIKVVEENPYRLVDDIYGIGFKKADQIAGKLGIAENDPFRIDGGIVYTLGWYISEGNTYAPRKELCEKTGQLLDVSALEIDERLVHMAFEGRIAIENSEGRDQVYLMPYYRAEMNSARAIYEISNARLRPVTSDIDSMIEMNENSTGLFLSDKQKNAVKSCIENGITVITGGPGTGKTTIINTIIKIFESSGHKVAIAAPTGRAAKRITETSGHEASTIHRLLEYYRSDENDVMVFGRDSENPLEMDVVIIDEASMIDILLMNSLLSAVKPGTRLIIAGDADQLPSVGAGNVLRDIIDSEYVFCTKLTEIFRQAAQSLIVVNAHRINRGEYPEYNEKDGEFFFMRKKTEAEMLETILDLCIRRLPAFYKHIDSLKDIQVLTPVRKGTLGTANLNNELQKRMNPYSKGKNEKKHGDRIFREGDKVMQIKNNYQLEWKRKSDFTEGEGIFNGDVGFIESIDNEYSKVLVCFDDDKYVYYDYSQLEELELAYAVTVHKSQGSEFPVVVMPISWFPPMLATRNLLYTAVTRGKEAVVIVGSENQLKGMVDNNRIIYRYSGLKGKIRRLVDLGL